MKKGFTLIELLAVIVILVIIASIGIISVNSVLKDTKKSLSTQQKHNIEKAAQAYHIKEGMNINATCVNVSELLAKGYIESEEVKDPSDRQRLVGSVLITYNNNQYKYAYQNDICTYDEE